MKKSNPSLTLSAGHPDTGQVTHSVIKPVKPAKLGKVVFFSSLINQLGTGED